MRWTKNVAGMDGPETSMSSPSLQEDLKLSSTAQLRNRRWSFDSGLPLAGGQARMAEYKKVSLSHHPRPLSEESRHSSREGTPTGWASLREVLFALSPLGLEVGCVRLVPFGTPRER